MAHPITAIIVDDEFDGREYVSLLLENEFPQIEILHTAVSIEQAYEHILSQTPDILFLDIQLADGSAFDLLTKTGELQTQIIFITAYEKYAIKAIKQDAVDYLLKPISPNDFIIAVNKALKRIHIQKQIQPDDNPKISLNTHHGFRNIQVSEIIHCEAHSNYTVVYLTDGSKIMLSRTLHEFEKQLTDYGFLRVHHKHLINLNHFVEYIKGSGGGKAIMSDQSAIDISVRKKNEFMERIKPGVK